MLAFFKKMLSFRAIRFLIAGSLGAVVHIGIVFILAHLLDVWYRYATVIGFLSAVGINFLLQKFFTFQDMQTRTIKIQTPIFFGIACINLLGNSVLMIFFVERMLLVPVVAQIVTALIIALWSYIAYGKLFKPSHSTNSEQH